MIYLDVTSACRSSLNTGVKRIQRGMHASLKGRSDYFPVCWQSACRSYRGLHADDLRILEHAGAPKGLGLFDSFAPGALTDWIHFVRDRASLLDWPTQLRAEDILLVPDLLWDNRGAFLARTKETPVRRIGAFHDAIALRRPGQSRIDGYFCRRGLRALAALDGVLCISAEAQDDLLRYWSEEKAVAMPTRIAPWPVPFAGPRPLIAPNFPARRLLYVARLEPHKNHLRLLDACEILWREGIEFHLELIGCLAYPDTAWKIIRRIRGLKRAGHSVGWRAHVEETELHAAYRDCSATVFPSLIEGFGLPVIESLWHGRPVVCGANGALGELAAGGGCETVETENLFSLAAGLRRILTEEARYNLRYAELAGRVFRTWNDYWREIDAFCGGRLTPA